MPVFPPTLVSTIAIRLVGHWMKFTPRIYVDVTSGGFAGYNFTDEKTMAGVSASVQAHYTGTKADFGVMLDKLWDLVGNKDVLIVGVSGRF